LSSSANVIPYLHKASETQTSEAFRESGIALHSYIRVSDRHLSLRGMKSYDEEFFSSASSVGSVPRVIRLPNDMKQSPPRNGIPLEVSSLDPRVLS
jgi:hypothetical protein